MTKRTRRPNVSKGTLVPLGNGFSLAVGKHPEKTDDIDIGPNNKNGLSVNHGEIIQKKGNNVRIFSAEPILGGVSPSQLLYGGMAPDKVFAMQEQYKRTNRIADDGSRYKTGGQTETPVKKGIDWSGIVTTSKRGYNSDYIDYINNGLIKAGIGKNQRAAILANVIEESGGNPFAVSSDGKFKGILQWEQGRYWPGDETDAYKELDNQIKYIVDTAGNSTDKKSWTHGGKGSGYNSLTDAMAAYNSEDDLAATMRGYTLGYVRPAGGINSYDNRLKVAEQIAGREGFQYGGDKNDFKTIKERTDFKQQGIKKFIVDKFGKWYYPNPVGSHGDFSRLYFGRPTKDNTFYISKYTPSKSKNKNAIYYGVKDSKFLNDLIYHYNNSLNINLNGSSIKPLLKPGDSRILNGYIARTSSDKDSGFVSDALERYMPNGDLANKRGNKSVTNYPITTGIGSLGNFTISRGNDENGDYLSYYDLWDLNGLSKVTRFVENNDLGKPYEIYDRIYGKFDDDGRFHPEGEIQPSIITANKKYGGIYIKPSKRGTFTAAAKKHGMGVQAFANKVLANKGSYSSAMVKKANFARNASKWHHHLLGGEDSLINPLGERPNVKLGKEMNKRKKALYGLEYPHYYTKRGSLIEESENLGNDFQSAFDGSDFSTLYDVNKSNRADALADTGVISSNPVKPVKPVNPIKPSTTFWDKTKNFMSSANGRDLIGAGINAAGSLIAAGINANAIRNLKFTPRKAIYLNPVKLKTKINIAPQIAKMRETVASLTDAARRTSASSRNAYQKIANARFRGLQAYSDLLGRKENEETTLINKDRLNQQQVAHNNAKIAMDVINTNIAGKDNLNNTQRMLGAQNGVSLVNNLTGIVAGPQGLLARREARIRDANNLSIATLPYLKEFNTLSKDEFVKKHGRAVWNAIANGRPLVR